MRKTQRTLGRITLIQRLARAHPAPLAPPDTRRHAAMDGAFAAAAGLLHDAVAPARVRAAARRALILVGDDRDPR